MTEPIILTWPQRAKMWAHFVAIILFCVMPLVGDASGVVAGIIAFFLGAIAMAVAQIHAGLFDLEIYMLTGNE